ncbi:hypothetical protein Rhopal_005938-T1 [Rhodotorula paludigena]|uniref:Uncharacterized protein n=1 Tax=Rhodotorula paludigena TaxID=86838 RepID=A0AAV5GRP9_9BASI|nr:hypothetical protein Rhopal_005938-T1 [Rhodotorula paludigena]
MKGLLVLYLVALAISITSTALNVASVAQTTRCVPFPKRGVDCGKSSGRDYDLLLGVSAGQTAATVTSGGDGEDEAEDRWGFCDNWVAAGYAHQLSLAFALGNVVALSLTLWGTATVGRGFRTDKLRSGWKLVAGLMTLQAVCMCVSTSLVAYEFHHNERFEHGAHLGRAWREGVVAYALNLFVVIVLLLTRVTGQLRMVPGEDGYEPISHGSTA